MDLGVKKMLLQRHISSQSGRVVLFKDFRNIATHSKNQNGNDLEEAVTELKKADGNI